MRFRVRVCCLVDGLTYRLEINMGDICVIKYMLGW